MPTRSATLPYTRAGAKAWAKQHVRGFYEAPITPFTPDFEIDEPAVRQIADQYVDWGVPVVCVGGNVSEGWNMTPTQWAQLHEIWADAVAGRMDLWTILLDPSLAVCQEKLAFVGQLGYTGAEVMNPVAYLVSDDDVYGFFEQLSASSNLALFLYRTPVTKVMMSIPLVQRLAGLDTVIGVKEGSLNHGEADELQRVCPDDFIVCYPVERHYLDHVRKGGQVLWATFFLTVYGKQRDLLREYVRLAEEGRYEEARVVSDRLDPARKLIDEVIGNFVKKTGSYARSIARIKVWFEAVGLPGGPVLPPVAQVSAAERDALAQRFHEVGVV